MRKKDKRRLNMYMKLSDIEKVNKVIKDTNVIRTALMINFDEKDTSHVINHSVFYEIPEYLFNKIKTILEAELAKIRLEKFKKKEEIKKQSDDFNNIKFVSQVYGGRKASVDCGNGYVLNITEGKFDTLKNSHSYNVGVVKDGIFVYGAPFEDDVYKKLSKNEVLKLIDKYIKLE